MLFEEFEPLFVDAVKRQERKTKRAGRAVIGSLKLNREQLHKVFGAATAYYTGEEYATKEGAARWAAAALDDLAEKALYDEFLSLCPDATEDDWNEHKADIYFSAVLDRLTEYRHELDAQIKRLQQIINGLDAARSWADTVLD